MYVLKYAHLGFWVCRLFVHVYVHACTRGLQQHPSPVFQKSLESIHQSCVPVLFALKCVATFPLPQRISAAQLGATMSGHQASLLSVYEMFRDEDSSGTGVSRNRCRAFLWATGHEVNDEQALDQIMMQYTGGGVGGTGVTDACVRARVCMLAASSVCAVSSQALCLVCAICESTAHSLISKATMPPTIPHVAVRRAG